MDESPSNALLTPWVISRGQGVGERRGDWEGMTGPGRIRTAFGGDWGCDEAGGDWGESTGDTAKGEVIVQRIYGVRKGEHRGSAVGVVSLVGLEGEQEAAGTRN